MKYILQIRSYRILLFSFLAIISCQNKDIKTLSSDKAVNAIFSKTELGQLYRLLHFVDGEVCQKVGQSSNDISICYQRFGQVLKDRAQNEGIIGVKFSDEKQKQLLQDLDRSLQKQLWGDWVTPNENFKEGNAQLPVASAIVFNPKGKLLELLKRMPEEEKAQFHVNTIKVIGDISPALIADLIVNFESYNVMDERIRLLLAVHYLIMSENAQKV